MRPLQILFRCCLRLLFRRPLILVQCAWCPDKERRTAAAEAWGFTVSHGMCPACARRELALLRCRQVERDVTADSFSPLPSPPRCQAPA